LCHECDEHAQYHVEIDSNRANIVKL